MAASLDAVLAAASGTGAVVSIPGLLNWLGRTPTQERADYQASLDGGFTECFEDYCTRISKKEPK